MLTQAKADVLVPTDTAWRAVLDRVRHDVFHTPEYHCLPGFGQEGQPRAFHYQEGDRDFLWPYLLTPIADAPGYSDATSVYGYPGPVGSADPEFLARAWGALQDHWGSQRIVSSFTRFNPILGNFNLLAELPAAAAGVREFGNTVAIDLTLSEKVHLQQYHKNLSYDIRKAREAGLVTAEDRDWTCADAFVAAYQDTMARCGSRPEYVVDRPWVDRFRATLGASVRLFVTKLGDSVAAAMLVIDYNHVLHCHLIGTASQHAAVSPSKVLLDDVRSWGARNGRQSMHLGGGLGGREDTLFKFKRRFSPLTQSFRTGSWILNESIYGELEARNHARLAAAGIQPDQVTYFPSYRFNPPSASGGTG